MVKHRFLGDVAVDRGLKLGKGIFVYNYYELLSQLKDMPDSEFKKILLENKSFFIDWITSEIGDFVLASKLKGVTSRKKYLSLISSRVKELEKASMEIGSLIERKKILWEKKTKIFPYVWFAVYGVLIAALLFQYLYYEEKTSLLSGDASFFYEELMETSKELFSLQSDLLEQKHAAERAARENKELKARNEALLEQVNIMALRPMLIPAGRIPESAISLRENEVVISVENPLLARFTDTGSMLPLITHDSKAIQVAPESHASIQPGDIISYEHETGNIIIHRVIETGFDEEGWYAVTRGDNVQRPDSGKVRFSQVKRVLVAIIY